MRVERKREWTSEWESFKFICKIHWINRKWGTSLVVQWRRIHLPTQETWVSSPVWKDCTCHEATEPLDQLLSLRSSDVGHNHRSPRTYSLCSVMREATSVRSPGPTVKSSPRSPQLAKVCKQPWWPSAGHKFFFFFFENRKWGQIWEREREWNCC